MPPTDSPPLWSIGRIRDSLTIVMILIGLATIGGQSYVQYNRITSLGDTVNENQKRIDHLAIEQAQRDARATGDAEFRQDILRHIRDTNIHQTPSQLSGFIAQELKPLNDTIIRLQAQQEEWRKQLDRMEEMLRRMTRDNALDERSAFARP